MTDRPEVRREPRPIVTRKPRPGSNARITITFAFDPSVFDDGGEDRSCPRTPEGMAWAIAAEVDSSDGTIGGGRLDLVSAAFEVTP